MVAQFKTTIHKDEGFFRLILYMFPELFIQNFPADFSQSFPSSVYQSLCPISPKISRLFIPDYLKCLNYFYHEKYLIKTFYNLRNSYAKIRYFCTYPTINLQNKPNFLEKDSPFKKIAMVLFIFL